MTVLRWKNCGLEGGHCETPGCPAGGSHRMVLMDRLAGVFCGKCRGEMVKVWERNGGRV